MENEQLRELARRYGLPEKCPRCHNTGDNDQCGGFLWQYSVPADGIECKLCAHREVDGVLESLIELLDRAERVREAVHPIIREGRDLWGVRVSRMVVAILDGCNVEANKWRSLISKIEGATR